MFHKIHRYYVTLGTELGLDEESQQLEVGSPALILVPVVGISRLTAAVLAHALATGDEVRALHAAFEGEPTEELEAAWQTWNPGVPLVVIPSPQRSVARAFLTCLAEPDLADHPNVIVLIGEIEPRKFRHRLLLNQRATILATSARRSCRRGGGRRPRSA